MEQNLLINGETLGASQEGMLATWLRSVVAHWLQMDTIHGNECVPTLIGAQGCGKTTFFVRLLPPHLREYYLDHLNLSNKFDKEMALTNNLLVNIDELESIRPSQQASLKQTLSKSKVNGRPIYGACQEDRARYASFVATTNNPHPLTDVTGSRRYICMTIPDGKYIDNTGEINYDQLYAQVLYELREQKSPYWFNNDEVARIQQLNQNYLDHLNLSNKFDKEMALTNNLLVNIDELDAIRPSQHAALKQTLSKSKVNGRPIYGASQEDRPRYASFVATTNNPHPLTDVTGSRRYICMTIPEGKYIDNTGEIDYDQLYAQVLYELRVQKSPYWFNNDEVARIQQLNQNYLEQKDIADIVRSCFRKPEPGELAQSMNCERLLEIITKEYPSVKATHGTKVYLGKAMRTLGFESTDCGHVAHYKVIPLKAA